MMQFYSSKEIFYRNEDFICIQLQCSNHFKPPLGLQKCIQYIYFVKQFDYALYDNLIIMF